MTSTTAGPPSPVVAGGDLVACHDCDLLQRIPDLKPGASASCTRCGALLRREYAHPLDSALALTIVSLIFFVLANTYTFMIFKVSGREEVNHMISGVGMLFERGMPSLAVAILMTSIVVPGIKIALSLYVLVPLGMGRTPHGLGKAYRWLQTLGPWGMLDVYLLGVLVAVVNLTSIASIELGTASYCFLALMFATTFAGARLPHRLIHAHLERLGR